jgi:single-strand DNA-binding protein
MLNRLQLIGRIGRINKPHDFDNGDRVVNFSLATEQVWNDETGERQTRTTWHQVAAWKKRADNVLAALEVGDLVYVEGPVTYREVQGVDFPRTQIRLARFERLQRPNGNGASGQQSEAQGTDHQGAS